MGGFSIWHLLILALFVLLLFGGNRFSSMMGDVAKGLKSFKEGMGDEEAAKRHDPKSLENRPIDVTPQPPRAQEPATPPPPPADDTTPRP